MFPTYARNRPSWAASFSAASTETTGGPLRRSSTSTVDSVSANGKDSGEPVLHRVYPRNWHLYNQAQMHEGQDFLALLGGVADLANAEYDTDSFRARLINVRQVGRNQRMLRNLRAAFNREVDPEKWEQMLTNKTIPFELPEPGVKIAIKVIDHTGMEHMTVIDYPRETLQK